MADLSVTTTSVKWVSGPRIRAKGGETVTNGQAVMKKTDGKWYKSDANGATNKVDGIVLSGGAVDQEILVQTGGVIAIGATVGVGTIYVLSGTAGGIALGAPGVPDLVSGWTTVIIGVGLTTANIGLLLYNSDVAVP